LTDVKAATTLILSRSASRGSLFDIFKSRSVAVVGASNNPQKAGHQVLKTLLRERYAGDIYAVNPHETSVLGLECFSSLKNVPGRLELLIISVPASAVVQVMEEAETRPDVLAAVILSAGFSETGAKVFIEAEKDITTIAHRAGIRVFGPNCIGIINPSRRLVTGFAPGIRLIPGNIGYITQSGAFGGALLMLAADQPRPLGFAKFGHVGNMSDVSNLELLDLYGRDSTIRVVAIYMEGVRNGRAFVNIAARVSARKPVVILKSGRTEGGAHAAISHTGTLAGSDAVYDAAFRQSGVVRANTIQELIDTSRAASMLPKPQGKRVCVLTEAGGPGIICLDEIASGGILQPALLSDFTKRKLKRILPSMAVICRPPGYIDMTAAALVKDHTESFRSIVADEGVDSVIVISLPPTCLPTMDVVKGLAPVIKNQAKPVLVCLMRGEPVAEARAYLEESGIPTFDSPDGAARALSNLTKATFVKGRRLLKLGHMRTHSIIAQAQREGRDLLEHEALRFLSDNNIRTLPHLLAVKKTEAQDFAESLNMSVVLKVVSPQIIHKSDVGAVRLNIQRGRGAVGKAFEDLVADLRHRKPNIDIRGVLTIPLAEPGPEVIIGMSRDDQFGPVIMFGGGGALVELLRDVSFRIAPFDLEVAREMIAETKAHKILHGIRGQSSSDIGSLARLLAKISRIAGSYPDIMAIDLNPVRVYRKGLSILDAKILLQKPCRS
jgi:acyl-CoA synthetase (NDP forming)